LIPHFSPAPTSVFELENLIDCSGCPITIVRFPAILVISGNNRIMPQSIVMPAKSGWSASLAV
jgi:hypothetical protein